MQRPSFETERHHDNRHRRGRHDDERDDRLGKQVREQRVRGRAVEVINRERRRRESCDKARRQHAKHIAAGFSQDREHTARRFVAARTRGRPFGERDQADHGPERHLETGIDDLVRKNREDQECCDRDRAHRKRRTIRDDA